MPLEPGVRMAGLAIRARRILAAAVITAALSSGMARALDPGKALGLTLFDIGTFFVPGVGEIAGVLTKVVGGLEKLLGTTMARLAEGVGTIERFGPMSGS